jgi:hypothetical protein
VATRRGRSLREGSAFLLRGLRSPRRAIHLWWSLALRLPHLVTPYRFAGAAERLLEPFVEGDRPDEEAYADLVRYFAEGWELYRLPEGQGAAYPGLPSWSGREADELEGFSRAMPLFGAWVASGRDREIALPSGKVTDLPGAFARGLRAGTDPDAPTWWGPMTGQSNQRIVEAADIALALWLFRETAWERLTREEQRRVVRWLVQLRGCQGLDNNWHLFFVLVDRVLDSLGHGGELPSAPYRWERVKDFHLGDGWFCDGPEGRVDYYNAWGFHYALHWIDRIDPGWDPGFIRSCRRRFLAGYKHLIGPRGIPILGRSICYRMAAPAPLVFGHRTDPDVVSEGEARRALDAVWCFFVRRGAVRRGTVTQGYFGSDPSILDPYSGPASGLWSLRSLVAAFGHPTGDSFWRNPGTPLPVERAGFEIHLEGPGWIVRGDGETGTISIEVLDNPLDAAPRLEKVRAIQGLRSLAFGEALRPKNWAAAYGRRVYRSDRPFFLEAVS